MGRMAARWGTICLLSSAVFLALALAVSVGGVFPFERDLYNWITEGASPTMVATFKWINYLGDKRFLLPATVLLLLLLPRPLRQHWWLWAAVMVGAPALEDLTKLVVGRPRPKGLGMGFPSGHVTAVAAFFVMTTYLAQISLARLATTVLWGCTVLFIVLVGIARIVLHAHWPLDTLGGAALGVACAAGAAWWHKRRTRAP